MHKSILFFLTLLSIASAISLEVEIEDMSCPADAGFLEVIYNLPTCIVERFFETLISGFIYSATEFLEHSLNFIITGPDLSHFCSIYTRIMRIIESLYIIALMGVGAYYIISSADPAKRARSKLWLQNLFFMIIILSFSYQIFEMILEINQYITSSIYEESFSDVLDIRTVFSTLIFALVFSFQALAAAGLTFMTLILRYILIPFLFLLFPIAIFLYFMPFGKVWGSFLLKFILLIVFMTSIDAILILGMSYLLEFDDMAMADEFVAGMVLVIGFGSIGIVNLIIYCVAIVSLVFSLFKTLESVVSLGWKIAMLASLL